MPESKGKVGIMDRSLTDLLLLIPFSLAIIFMLWALWNFWKEAHKKTVTFLADFLKSAVTLRLPPVGLPETKFRTGAGVAGPFATHRL
jgi:hypothetical protein